jgi:hypothetical protein
LENIRKKNNSFFHFFDYIIVLFIILGTQSVLNASTSKGYMVPIILVGLLAVRILTLLTSRTNVGPILIFIFLWIVYIGIYAVFSPGKTVKLIEIFVIMLLLLVTYFYVYMQKYDFRELLIMYSNIIFLIACISLFFWPLGSILNVIKPSGTLEIDWGGNIVASNYYFIYYQWQHDAVVLGHSIFRNIGIFCEAPMFSLNLTTAFMLDYLIVERRSFRRIVVYILTLLSTVSVTGVILIIMVIVLDKFFEYVSDSFFRKRFRIGLITFPMVAILAGVIGYSLLSNKLSSASGSSRMEDYISGFRAWQLNYFWGNGYGDTSARISFSSLWRLARSETGYTNSIMTVLSEGGIYFFVSYLITFMYIFNKAMQKKNYKLIIFISMWIYLFLTTTFAHTTLMISFMAFVFSLMISKQNLTNNKL